MERWYSVVLGGTEDRVVLSGTGGKSKVVLRRGCWKGMVVQRY